MGSSLVSFETFFGYFCRSQRGFLVKRGSEGGWVKGGWLLQTLGGLPAEKRASKGKRKASLYKGP